jgi:hypothetical protein
MITEQQQGTSQRVELFEIIELIEKTKKEEEVVALLQKYGNFYTSVKDYLRCLFDEKIEFLLPDGKPPYAPCDPNRIPSTWHKQHMNLRYFVKMGVTDDVGQMKRERMFIRTLESMHPDDALIICKMVEKKTTTKKITKEVAKKAFPDLFP